MELSILVCPICSAPLHRKEHSFFCEKNHCFDIARQGYVNLLPVQQKHSKNPGDTRDMVAARKAFLDGGYYQPIADTVAALLQKRLPERPVILDAGCGEGYYMTRLQDKLELEQATHPCCIGVDISKEAVRFASVRNRRAIWLTASAVHLPLAGSSADAVMSMFALTVPEEFHRVLKPGGYFLEVTAGRGHLMALKNLIYSEIIEKQEKQDHGYAGFTLEEKKILEFPLELQHNEEIMQLLSMTPHFWRITREGAARAELAQTLSDLAQVEFRLYRRD